MSLLLLLLLQLSVSSVTLDDDAITSSCTCITFKLKGLPRVKMSTYVENTPIRDVDRYRLT